jgi:hypothetical protein
VFHMAGAPAAAGPACANPVAPPPTPRAPLTRGPQVTAREYLEAALTPAAGSGPAAEAKNAIRAGIKGLFPDRRAAGGRGHGALCLHAARLAPPCGDKRPALQPVTRGRPMGQGPGSPRLGGAQPRGRPRWRRRDCATLVRPMHEERALVCLDTTPVGELRSEFRDGVARLLEVWPPRPQRGVQSRALPATASTQHLHAGPTVDRAPGPRPCKHHCPAPPRTLDAAATAQLILRKAQPKRLGGYVLTGPALAGLAAAYVEAINGGAVPTIATAWQGVAEQESRRAADAAEAA